MPGKSLPSASRQTPGIRRKLRDFWVTLLTPLVLFKFHFYGAEKVA